jgi:hypothetical protein
VKVSIDVTDRNTELERAQSEAKVAVERARIIVERSRALLFGKAAQATGPAGPEQSAGDMGEESLIKTVDTKEDGR